MAFRKSSRIDAKVPNCVGLTTCLGQLSHWLLSLTVKTVLLIPLFFITNCLCILKYHIPLFLFIKKKKILLNHTIFP